MGTPAFTIASRKIKYLELNDNGRKNFYSESLQYLKKEMEKDLRKLKKKSHACESEEF